MTDTEVSVVICTYLEDRWPQLVEAVESVTAQTFPPREVIVAVDHNERLLAQLRRRFGDIRVIDNVGSLGKPGALSTAIAEATGSIIALLDDDARAESTWLEELVNGYADPRVLGVGGRLDPIWSDGRPRWFPDEFLWVVGCSYRGLPRSRAAVRNLIGANMSFRREVFLQASAADAGLSRAATAVVAKASTVDATQRSAVSQAIADSRHALEDTELCLRANRMWGQGKWIYEPRARVEHHVSASRARWSYFRSRCYVEGLAKARLADEFGSDDALHSERRYAIRTLPSGVMHALTDVVIRRDPAGLARAAVIVAGLALTARGYLRGRLESARTRLHG